MLTCISANGKLVYDVMDCTNMDYPDNHFDYVFDKGTIDALACGDNDDQDMRATVLESIRVLKSGGIYVIVSFAEPSRRMEFFETENVTITHEIIVNEMLRAPGNEYHVYILRKL